MPSVTITGISSMATRQVLADLAAEYREQTGVEAAIESVGGVDAAKRVRAGEAFDVVVLASDAIDKLLADGHLVAGSRVDLVQSGVAVAVRAGAAKPSLASEADMRAAVLAARTLGYSTGPSGVQLAKLFERWGIAERIAGRIVQAPPGVPVGTLVARGDVELGFQQRSELLHLDGIEIVGGLPEPIQIVTTFSGAVGAKSMRADEARRLLAFLASPAATPAKQRHGMQAATAATG